MFVYSLLIDMDEHASWLTLGDYTLVVKALSQTIPLDFRNEQQSP